MIDKIAEWLALNVDLSNTSLENFSKRYEKWIEEADSIHIYDSFSALKNIRKLNKLLEWKEADDFLNLYEFIREETLCNLFNV